MGRKSVFVLRATGTNVSGEGRGGFSDFIKTRGEEKKQKFFSNGLLKCLPKRGLTEPPPPQGAALKLVKGKE